MTSVLARLLIWLNTAANALGEWLLLPIAWLPGWLSATIIAVVSGVLFLAAFKYTSPQRAIKRVRDDISANLLALKLFKESALVSLKSQGRLLIGAFWMLLFALLPMVVMLVPAALILGQLSMWYQQRPLKVGEEAVVTMKLNSAAPMPDVSLQPTEAVETTIGPVCAQSKHEVCWNIKARKSGYHHLAFQVGDQTVDKELAIGDGFMRVSAQRPGWVLKDLVENPGEQPFGPDSAVQAIDIKYSERDSKTSGTGWWVGYWCAVSLVAGFCFRRVLNVQV